MALKGKAKIELVNADGSKEVVEHGNMITDAVADLLYAARGEMSNIMRISSNGDSLVENIFGGILLFKDNLSEDAADYYIPSVNTTGYASVSAYSGQDSERGSFNSIESGLQEDGSYKLVWDFATSQANGVIRAIGLCPNMMGKIGMSNTAVSSEQVSAKTTLDYISPYTTGMGADYYYHIVAVIGNIAYALHTGNVADTSGYSDMFLKNNGGILKVYRFDICSSGIGLKSIAGKARYIDCVDVQLPSDFVSLLSSSGIGIDVSYDEVGKKIILTRIGVNIYKGNSVKYLEIELENNMNVTERTFTNNANGSVFLNSNYTYSAFSGNGTFSRMFISKDYIVTMVEVDTSKSIYKLFVTNKLNNTDIKEVKRENGQEYTCYKYSDAEEPNNLRPIFTFGNLFVFGYSQGSQYTSFKKVCVLDMATGLLKETNANEMTYKNNVPLANKVTWGKTWTNLGLSISVNPFVLTTKNNLDAPVTKTASQTMKITYTLTETAESGV